MKWYRDKLGHRNEQGVASLLTVIFFMVFISIITMGFITIVIADQRQAIDNDLSASALAAARSGIEDGKRLLVYCQEDMSRPGCYDAVHNLDNCDVLSSGLPNTLASSLGININANGESVTGGSSASAYQQYFTCLTIQVNTPSLTASLTPDSDYIQHLESTPTFAGLYISWSGEGGYLNRTGTITSWPVSSSWGVGVQNYMPVIRFQSIPYPTTVVGGLDLNSIEANSRTVFIVPCETGACAVTDGSIGIDLRDGLDVPGSSGGLRPLDQVPIIYAKCDITGTTYTCGATLTGYDDSGNSQYYIRASVLYAAETTMTITPVDAGGAGVTFQNVQPWIDVTGRTNDVFKRVRSQVSYQQTTSLQMNALESAAPICKKLVITGASATYTCP